MNGESERDAFIRHQTQRAQLVDIISLEFAHVGVSGDEALARSAWIADRAIEMLTGRRPSTVGEMQFATEAEKTAVSVPASIGRHLGDACASCVGWDQNPIRYPHSLSADGTAHYFCEGCERSWTCWWDPDHVRQVIGGGE